MNVRIVTLAVAVLAAGIALAQPANPPHRGGPDMDRMAILLDLDAGQKAAVQKVFEEQAAQRKAAREEMKQSQTRPSREDMRAQHEKTQKETQDKLRAILSDTQMTKFEALTQFRGERSHGRRDDKANEKTN